MTDHSRFQDDLKAYADGELSWPRRLAVRRHLTRCASCREELTQMTQIAEDLRPSETADALDPALRAKILGIQEPTPAQAPTLPKREGEEFQTGQKITPLRPPVSGGTLRSDLSRSKEMGFRKRPSLVWGALAVVVLVWFFVSPMFQKVHEKARRIVAMSPAMPQSRGAGMNPMPTGDASSPLSYYGRTNGGGGGYPGGDLTAASPASGRFAAPLQQANSGSALAALAGPDALSRQVHKEASIGVQVANPEAASDNVEMLVKESGGFVATNTLNTGDDSLKSAQMTVKVPVTQFEAVLAQIAKLGSVQSKNVTGEDITDKTSDADQTENVLEGDVANSEARLKALGAKAKWSDQQATRDLRTQLAEARARLVLLRRMAALSTITVDLSQTPKPSAPAPVTNGFLDGLKGNTHDALQSLMSSAGALLALAIWLLAYAPIWIPLFLVGRYALREYRKRQAV